jgi:phosphoglycolate phosphatase
MTTQAVIFDMDGTLLDTLADLADASNRMLAAHGYPTHAVDDYRWFVGDGSTMLIKRALPPGRRSPETIRICLQEFISDYNQSWDRKTVAYPGIVELLDALQDRKIKLSVVTNKPQHFADQMASHYFPNIPFNPIFGQRDGIPIKPDPAQALAAAEQMQTEPANCMFVGDSAVDMETAQRAGMQPVGASWGYRTKSELRKAGADKIIDHPSALRSLIADSG